MPEKKRSSKKKSTWARTFETLEDRNMLTSYLVIDYTPDAIPNEIRPDPFLAAFNVANYANVSTDPRDTAFLDFPINGVRDGVVDGNDAKAFADAIAQNVRGRFQSFLKDDDLDFQVVWRSKDLDHDTNDGQRLLNLAKDSDENNVYVVYVGGKLPLSLGDFEGIADQALEGRNHEWYSYVFAQETADKFVRANDGRPYYERERHPDSIVASKATSSDGQSIFATLQTGSTGELTRLQAANGNFTTNGVQPGDEVRVYYTESNGDYRVEKGSATVKQVVNATTLELDDSPYLAGSTWTQGQTLKIEVSRQVRFDSTDFVNRIGLAIAHEAGHLLGLGHVRRDENHSNPRVDRNLMNYSADWTLGRFPNKPSPYETEVRNSFLTFDTGFSWEDGINSWQEVYDSLATDEDGDFLQTADYDLSGKTYDLLLSQQQTQPLDEETAPAFQFDFSQRTAPAASTGVKGTTTANSLATQLTSAFTTFQQQVVGGFSNGINLPTGGLPLMSTTLGTMLGLSDVLQSAVGSVDVHTATTMAQIESQLTALGFKIDQRVTDSQLAALPTNQPADFLRFTKTYHLASLLGSTTLNAATLGTLGDLSGLNFSGSLRLDADTFFSLTFGIDTGGFYVLPGQVLASSIEVDGDATATIGSIGNVKGKVALDLLPVVSLSSPNADGRIRLANMQSSLTNLLSVTTNGAAAADLSFNLTALPSATPLQFGGQWLWSIENGAVTLDSDYSGFNTESLLDSVAATVGSGITELGKQASSIAALGKNLPFIGDSLTTKLGPVISGGLGYDNGGSARDYLAENGITIESIVSPRDFLTGAYATKNLVLLRYQQSVTPSTPLTVAAGGVEGGGNGIDFRLTGNASVQPAISIDLRFGLDSSGGPFVMEGGFVDATLSASGHLSGSADIGSLLEISAQADASFNAHD